MRYRQLPAAGIDHHQQHPSDRDVLVVRAHPVRAGEEQKGVRKQKIGVI
jgi:hypothetical protein